MRFPLLRSLPPLALSLTLLACGGGDSAGPDARPLDGVVVVAGDAQRGEAGAELPEALVVRVIDADGRPVPRERVTFVVTRGGGTLSPGEADTDAGGVARTRWTLGSGADSQRVEVRAVDPATRRQEVYAAFTAKAVAGAAAKIFVVAGAGQSAPAGVALPVAPRVRVTDRFDNPVAGATVSFAVAAGGGRVTGETATTDARGEATVGAWILGPVSGAINRLTATSGALVTTIEAGSTTPVQLTLALPGAGSTVGGEFSAVVVASTLLPAGAITSVVATVDGRTTTLAYDAAGSVWWARIPMAGSGAGAKSLSVTATDGGGNTATTTTSLTYVPPVPPPASPIDPQAASYVRLVSDAGDYIGGGRSYEYTKTSAILTATTSGGQLNLNVSGDEDWFANFQGPAAYGQLYPGTYTGLQRFPFHVPAVGGLSWSGEGRGCNMLTGSFTIYRVTYVVATLKAVDMTFEQHCEGQPPALRGTIHWRADDAGAPPGPVVPAPTTLWRPPTGATPATGSYVYLASDAGDYIGGGGTFLYAPPTTAINVSAAPGRASVTVGPWHGDFQAMSSLTQLAPGYYPNLQRFPFHNPVRGGLDWSGNGRGCNTLTGWFVVDRITYSGALITALDLRFEQHCEGQTPALHGAIHWEL